MHLFLAKKKRVFVVFTCSCNIKELCEQTTRLHAFLNHKRISELLHNRQNISISLCSNNTFQDNKHLQKHLEFVLDSLHKCNTLGQTTRKRNKFDLQKEYCTPATQTSNAGIDNRFCQQIEMSFCAGRVYQNTLYLDITRPQRE